MKEIPPIQELAGLLAQAYLRLLVACHLDPEIAQDPVAQESPIGPQIGVDVAGDKMAQLARESRR